MVASAEPMMPSFSFCPSHHRCPHRSGRSAPTRAATDILVHVTLKLPTLKQLSPVFTIAVFGVASWVIYDQLKAHPLGSILEDLGSIPTEHLVLSAALVLPGLMVLAAYDLVACTYLKLKLGVLKPLLTGLMSYSITNSTGHAVVVGGILRLRVYPRWGVKAAQVGEIIGFGVLTYYIGLSFTAAMAFLFEGKDLQRILADVPRVGHVLSSDWLGILVPVVLLGLIAVWGALLVFRRKPIRFRSHTFQLPSPMIGLFQLAVSCADLVIVSSVLFIMLPNHNGINWLAFVGIFSVIQFAALLSGVPGGIGVFSAIMLVVLQPPADGQTEVFAVLIAFRALYYLIPFAIGGLAFLGFVVVQNSRGIRQRVAERGEGST